MGPHEPVGGVDLEVEAAAKDGSKAVKLLPRFDATLFGLLGGHAARCKRDHAIAITGIEPPAIVEKAAFLLQPRIEWSPRERREMVEGDDIKAMALGEGQGFLQRVAIVLVVSQNESYVEADFMTPQIFESLLVPAFHHVEAFVHAAEVFRVKRFKADQQSLAAASFDETEKLFVVGSVDAGLTDPADFQRNECAKEFLRLIHVGSDVVVDEEQKGLLNTPDFVDD